MKPHALRKALWMGNGVLALGVVAAGLNLLDPPSVHAEADRKVLADALVPVKGEPIFPRSPVTREEVFEVFPRWERPKYEREHFWFTGPLPPGLAPEPPDPEPDAKPQDLFEIGTPGAMICAPPDSVLFFLFDEGGAKAFRVGDWIRPDTQSARRFRFLSLEKVDVDPSSPQRHVPKAFVLLLKYAVYENGIRQRVATRKSQNFTNVPAGMQIMDLPVRAQKLTDLGTPTSLVFAPPDHVLLFEFKSGTSEAFGVGEWIRHAPDEAEQFRFEGLEPVDKGMRLTYGIYERGTRLRSDTFTLSQD